MLGFGFFVDLFISIASIFGKPKNRGVKTTGTVIKALVKAADIGIRNQGF